jgi:hypothetical protein
LQALRHCLNAPIMIAAMRRCRNAAIPNGLAQSPNQPIINKSSIVNPQSPMDAAAAP